MLLTLKVINAVLTTTTGLVYVAVASATFHKDRVRLQESVQGSPIMC